MRMVDLIIKKRQGHELTDEEIRFWIKGYVDGEIPDYQSSAMQMAIVFQGMNNREIATLTDAMLHSGEVLNLSNIKGVKVDKHSTGGVGDKTSLVLGPMVAACGATLAKMSGRGLGHTGGTLDKLESIPGVTIAISGERFVNQVNDIGCAIVGQTGSLVPADKKMYALRDVTGTVESIPLIASSVMSKKLASGSDVILLDVTVGEGAFMKNVDDARKLAHIMVDIGRRLGRDTRAVLSNMSEPLGLAVGNSLEVKEAIAALNGNGPEDLMELCYVTGSIMLEQAKVFSSREKARVALEEAIKSGAAFDKFVKMVKAQGGDIEYILHPEKFEMAKEIIPIYAEASGYIKTLDDVIDMSAGIVLNKKVGDQVKEGELLATLYTNKPKEVYEPIALDVLHTFEITSDFVEHQKVIIEVIE